MCRVSAQDIGNSLGYVPRIIADEAISLANVLSPFSMSSSFESLARRASWTLNSIISGVRKYLALNAPKASIFRGYETAAHGHHSKEANLT